MNVLEYMIVAESTDQLEPKDPGNSNYKVMPIVGLAGEIGSLLAELKKRVRDTSHIVQSRSKARIEEELGDIIWYAVTLSRRAGLHFQKQILFGNLARIKDNPGLYLPLLDGDEQPGKTLRAALDRNGVSTVSTFSSYQELASLSHRLKDKTLLTYLAKIWTNSGELFGVVKLTVGEFTQAESTAIAQRLGDVMWYVAGIATLYKLDLDKIAGDNARKALSMFPPPEKRHPTPLTIRGKSNEQFPPRFDVDFVSVDNETAIMMVNGLQIGDPVKDNAYQLDVGPDGIIDGYRFHDCIHLAFVGVLGWSPVIRGLMKRKRKTDKAIDDAEDGARAQIVEEMIVKLTHLYAISVDNVNLLNGQTRVSMDLLKQVENLAQGLEVTGSFNRVEPCKLWEWEKAILLGYELFGKLRQHKRGRVRVDLVNRTVAFSELKDGEGGQFPVPV